MTKPGRNANLAVAKTSGSQTALARLGHNCSERIEKPTLHEAGPGARMSAATSGSKFATQSGELSPLD